MGVVGEPTGRWMMPGAPASYSLHHANYRPAPEEQGALGEVSTRRRPAGRGSWRPHSEVAAGWLRRSPLLLLADSVWVLGCSEGPVLPHTSRTRVHAVLFPHERQKIHVEGSLGGVTYNLGDVRGGSHSQSWHRRGVAVSQASCRLLSASTSVQTSSCLTSLRV